ncbi:MAG: hypothetical protein QM736_24120 [Vicinamibacterales bacterium]
MNRVHVLGLLLLVGLASSGVRAYQRPAGDEKMVIDVDRVRPNLYVFKGGGGNTAVFVGSTNVVVVDAKNPGWGAPILARIQGDHRQAGDDVDQHACARRSRQRQRRVLGGCRVHRAGERARLDEEAADFEKNHDRGIPRRTFKDKLSFGLGPDRIDLYHFGPGHTDGDAWVVFPALKVAHAGDMFAGKSLPLVDGASGGSVLQYADSLEKAYTTITGVETIINGHAPTTSTWKDLGQFIEFNRDFLKWAENALGEGRTPEDAAPEWKVPARYDGYSTQVTPLFGGVAGMLTVSAAGAAAATALTPSPLTATRATRARRLTPCRPTRHRQRLRRQER